jgi:presenilin-like A22 family membrane protease
MKILATQKSEQNEAAVDPWTVVHLATGLALGLVNAPQLWALAASVTYELSEQVFERREWGKQFFETSGPESLPNALMDSTAFLIGYRLGRRWNER